MSNAKLFPGNKVIRYLWSDQIKFKQIRININLVLKISNFEPCLTFSITYQRWSSKDYNIHYIMIHVVMNEYLDRYSQNYKIVRFKDYNLQYVANNIVLKEHLDWFSYNSKITRFTTTLNIMTVTIISMPCSLMRQNSSADITSMFAGATFGKDRSCLHL